MRALILLFVISVSVAHGQDMPAESKIVKNDLEEFSESYYPAFRVEYLRVRGSKSFDWQYWDQDDSTHSCAGEYFGGSRKVLLIECVELGSGSWRPPVHYYAFLKQGDKLVDSKREIFPIREIFDQLQYFVVDSEKAESWLSDETDNTSPHDFIEFLLDGEDVLLVSIRSIEGVIEGAVYASMVWDEEQNSFVVVE